tara:strand:+ start:143 stop:298 length:156 start_codon:yes stop_codon:yes gene_type:complete
MANTYLPDQSDDFKKSGMRLITDPSSDSLLSKAAEKREVTEDTHSDDQFTK